MSQAGIDHTVEDTEMEMPTKCSVHYHINECHLTLAVELIHNFINIVPPDQEISVPSELLGSAPPKG